MKSNIKKALAVAVAAILLFPAAAVAVRDVERGGDYEILNPYSEVVWTGDGAWKHYKGNLHTHSYVSDAEVDYRDMVLEHYNQGFDFLAMTDHGVTGKAWNDRPTELPLYLYQRVIGNWVNYLSDEEFAAVTSGSYPVDGAARGYGMTCVEGGNELNALTITKDHVNAIFLPEHAGDNYLGFENDYEGAVRLADHYGALSFINHIGDWIESSGDRSPAYDERNLSYISDILLRYDSCLGIEVFNENNTVTAHDRDLWDNLLMECLPYGKTIIGYSNNDAHFIRDVDTSFCEFMMEENTIENIKKTMQTGSSFLITRRLPADTEKYGPATDMEAKNTDLPYPVFTSIAVDGHTITVEAKNAYNIQWVANSQVIDSHNITQSEDATSYTIDLDAIEGSDEFLYVRCQLLGDGGVTLTQAFVLDDGSEPLEYQRDNSPAAVLKRFVRQFLSLRIFVIFDELFKAIKNAC